MMVKLDESFQRIGPNSNSLKIGAQPILLCEFLLIKKIVPCVTFDQLQFFF